MYGAPSFAPAGADTYSSSSDNDSAPDDNHHRKRRRMGKESAALGIFGDDSDDEDTRPGKQWKSKNLRGKGMAFVSSMAPKNPDTEYSEEENDNNPDFTTTMQHTQDGVDDDDIEEDHEPTSFFQGGLGFNQKNTEDDDNTEEFMEQDSFTPSSFMGSRSSKTSRSNIRRPKPQAYDSSNPLGTGFVPSSSFIPKLNADVLESQPKPTNVPKPSAFSGGKKSKFGNSFAQRMMLKMGYKEGEGLGAESQGRNIVIEAHLRPQGVGLGAVKEKSEQERKEEKRQASMRGEEMELSSDEERRRRKKEQNKSLQKKNTPTERAKARVAKGKFLTTDELKRTAPGLNIPEAFTPILDMTGPEVNTLTSAAGLLGKTQPFVSASVVEPPEVLEKRKVIRQSHIKLAALSEEWSTLNERNAWADRQLDELTQNVDNMAADIERLTAFNTVIMDELPQAQGWKATLACLNKAMAIGASSEDFMDLIVAVIYPLIKEAQWNPLLEPDRFTRDLLPLAPILLGSSTDETVSSHRKTDDHIFSASRRNEDDLLSRNQRQTTSYESLMYKLWLPVVLTAIRSWNAHDPDIMLTLVTRWRPLLPDFVHAQLMDAITRHIDATLSSWNPKRASHSANLPHTWVFPWLPHVSRVQLDPKGDGLVANVKRKFRTLFSAWDYSKGLIPGLSVWIDVFGSEWKTLILTHAMPAIGNYLRRNFRVDPGDQGPYLASLQGVLKWEEVLGSRSIGEVVKSQVFPMWHKKLHEWLTTQDVNLAEVAEWFAWWDGVVLPRSIQKLPSVREELEKGLQTMEKGLENLVI